MVLGSAACRVMALVMLVTAGSLLPVSANDDEPDIVIRYEEGRKITEFRRNGEILEIKVEPDNAPVYYLVPNPDGELVYSEHSRLYLPSWKLLEW